MPQNWNCSLVGCGKENRLPERILISVVRDARTYMPARSGTACRAPTERNPAELREIGALLMFLFLIASMGAEGFDHR